MASKNSTDKAPTSLAEGVDKELTCAICLCRFDHPKVLPCLHSYCKGCLVSLVEKARDKSNITCPQCQETHEVHSNGIDGFRTHFTYNNLIELLQIHDDTGSDQFTVILCESGLDENPAVARCLTCEDYLCKGCYAIHTKQKATRSHKVSLLEEIKSSSKEAGIKSIRKTKYCDEHKDEVIKLFCKTCQSVICRDCVLVTHREHDYVFVQEVRQETQQKLESLMDAVRAKETETQAHSDLVKDTQTKNVETLDISKKEIEKAFKEVVDNLEARKSELLSQLHQSHKIEEKQLEAEAVTVGLTLLRLSDSLRFMCELLDNGDDVEVMVMSKQAQQTLENLSNTTWNKDTIKPMQLTTRFSPQTKEAMKTFGTVCCSSLKTEQQCDIAVLEFPNKIRVSEPFKFKAKLTTTVLGKDPPLTASINVGKDDLTIQCTKEAKDNLWCVSYTPKTIGEHTLVLRVGDFPPVTQAFQVLSEYKTRDEFPDDTSYGEYVKATLKPNMRVRAIVDFNRVNKGSLGTFVRSNNGTPPAQFSWESLQGDTYWVYWYQVELC